MHAQAWLLALLVSYNLEYAVGFDRPLAPDPTGFGPLQVGQEEYRLPAQVDELVLTDRVVEYWAVIWRPLALPDPAARLPLAVFLHGNHATCAGAFSTCHGGLSRRPAHALHPQTPR